MEEWRFFVFIGEDGQDEVSEWLAALPSKVSAKIRHILAHQRLCATWKKDFCDNLEGYSGLYELKIDWQRQHYRILGCFGTGRSEFTFVDGVQKEARIPRSVLKRAAERIAVIKLDGRRRREFRIY